jgi:hypothetical protein
MGNSYKRPLRPAAADRPAMPNPAAVCNGLALGADWEVRAIDVVGAPR